MPKKIKQPKTMHALRKLLADAGLSFTDVLDDEGQVILFTGLRLVQDGDKEVLVPMDASKYE